MANWYEKSKQSEGIFESPEGGDYLDVAHKRRSKEDNFEAWVYSERDGLVTEKVTTRYSAPLHDRYFADCWASGRVDHDRKIVSISVRINFIPTETVREAKAFLKEVLEERFPGYRLIDFTND